MHLMTPVGSEEELKKEYKKLAMVYHPDRGGNTALMQKLNLEYQQLKEQFITQSPNKDDLKVGDRGFLLMEQRMPCYLCYPVCFYSQRITQWADRCF